ncbi:probable N-acetyltransferase HLS1 [Cucurbita maxima]|uniref:Probable N-acetyltransferase HLS1 n=1 Tax=Cucurbita maxima TaxID=3661 RepID=A0A6J1J285_CUCMA|nr:probable N-acetyltransferase HLS1 [Cucurbita maxima]
MVQKIADEYRLQIITEQNSNNLIVVRAYCEERDKVSVEELERQCDVGQKGKASIFTDLLGDPICRIRHFPLHLMLVAEYGEARDIVGVIRGCIKHVTPGHSHHPLNLAYILGLRVSTTHRRLGVGTKLVEHVEKWCKQKGADYAYIATECANQPCINMFTHKFSYTKFRSPTVLVQPVHAHYKPISSGVAIVRIPPHVVVKIYRQLFANAELFPMDIDAILSNKLNLGTFMAVPKKLLPNWNPETGILPQSFAVLSVWNTKEVFKLQVKGVSKLTYACCMGSRVLDSWLPWLRLPSFPDVFSQFGVYFLYGLSMRGSDGPRLLKFLCRFVHNMAKDDVGCGAVVAEVGQQDPVRAAIPHWRRFSWSEDLWCIKKLRDLEGDECNWIKSPPSSAGIFVDPRDI